MARKVPKRRADLLLVERGLAESRERAQALIMEGLVYSPAGKVLKPGSLIDPAGHLEVRGRLPYVSRGGIKLAHALDSFRLDVTGIVALDVGASTGGFTDCMLQRGARRAFALDVGHSQLDYRLRRDPRVVVMEGVNARHSFSLSPATSLNRILQKGDAAPLNPRLEKADVTPLNPRLETAEATPLYPPLVTGDTGGWEKEKVELATVDVSFISVTKVIPSVAQHVKVGGHLIVLLKPQFEAKREEVGRGGVIRDVKVHSRVLARAIAWVVDSGLRLRNLTPSPILGDAGNREFFLHLGK